MPLHALTFAVAAALAGQEPLSPPFDVKAYFPTEIGNTWIWDGERRGFSVRTVTGSRGEGGREEITIEARTKSGDVEFWDEMVLENGRIHRAAIRFPVGTSIEYSPAVLWAPFSGKVGESETVEVSERTGGPEPRVYFRRVTIVERRPVGTVLGTFADCIIVRTEELASADAEKPSATMEVWYARDVGPIRFRGVDRSGRSSEHQVVYARVGTKRIGLDPREDGQ